MCFYFHFLITYLLAFAPLGQYFILILCPFFPLGILFSFFFSLSLSLSDLLYAATNFFFNVFNVVSISFHVFCGFSLLCLVIDVLNFNMNRLWSFFLHCIFLRNFYFYFSFKITSIFFYPFSLCMLWRRALYLFS